MLNLWLEAYTLSFCHIMCMHFQDWMRSFQVVVFWRVHSLKLHTHSEFNYNFWYFYKYLIYYYLQFVTFTSSWIILFLLIKKHLNLSREKEGNIERVLKVSKEKGKAKTLWYTIRGGLVRSILVLQDEIALVCWH